MLLRSDPSWPLCDYVSSLWLFEGEQPTDAFERILPDGNMQVVINLREDRITVTDGSLSVYPGTVLSGPFSRSFVIDTAQQCQTMGISFRPGRAAAFLGIPAAELYNIHDCPRRTLEIVNDADLVYTRRKLPEPAF